MRHAFAALLVLAALVGASRAHADDDGLYARLDGDVRLSAGVGAGARFAATTAPVGVVELRARYLDSAGVFVAGDTDDARWRVTTGVELRPLFLARFLLNKESGRAFFDLLVDSLELELGVAATALSTDPLAGFVLGTGLDVPFTTDALRIGLHVGFRWTFEQQRRIADATDVLLFAALVIDVPVHTGLAAREGPRSIAVP